MSSQRYSPVFKDEAVRQIVERAACLWVWLGEPAGAFKAGLRASVQALN